MCLQSLRIKIKQSLNWRCKARHGSAAAHGNGNPKPFHIAAGGGPLFQRPCRAAAARPCQASPAAFSGCLAGCRPAAPHGRPAPVVFVLQWRRGAAWIAARCRPPFLCIIPGRRLEPCACMPRPHRTRRRRPWACLRGSMACPATEVSCSPSWAHVSAFIELAMIVHRNLYKLSLTQTVYVVG